MVSTMQTDLPNDDTFLTTDELAEAYRKLGYRVSPKTLSTKRSRGGGPEFHKFGDRVLYQWGPSRDWLTAGTIGPLANTSQWEGR
jgi:hypothetical protein